MARVSREFGRRFPTASAINREAFGGLSTREEQVLSLAASGFLDKQIGQELGVSLNTLRTYWSRIRSKVGEAPRSALAVAYVDHASHGLADSEGLGTDEDPDWEIDLRARVWRRISDKPIAPGAPTEREMDLDRLLEYMHPDDFPRISDLIAQIERDDTAAFSYSARMIGPNGPWEAGAFVRVVREDSGQAIKLVGRRVPIHAYRDQDIRNIRVGHWSRDLQSGEFIGDEGFREIFGIDPDEPDLRSAAFKRFHPDEVEHTRTFVSDAVAARKRHSRSTHRLLSVNGSFKWVTTDLTIEYDGDTAIKALGTVIAFN